jgi:hypothetical protein
MTARPFIPIALCLVWAGSAEAQYSVGVSAVIVDGVEASAPQVELTREGDLLLVDVAEAGRSGSALLEAVWLAPVAGGSHHAEAVATWRQAGRGFRLDGVVDSGAAGAAGVIPDGGWVSVPGGVSGVALPDGMGPLVVTRVIASNS